jgi:hypothetical protein
MRGMFQGLLQLFECAFRNRKREYELGCSLLYDSNIISYSLISWDNLLRL